MPVSIFLGSCTILLVFFESSPIIEIFEVDGLLRRRSGAKCAIRFTDLTRSFCDERCIVCLRLVGTDPYLEGSGSRGAGGQLRLPAPIKLYKSSYNNTKLFHVGN